MNGWTTAGARVIIPALTPETFLDGASAVPTALVARDRVFPALLGDARDEARAIGGEQQRGDGHEHQDERDDRHEADDGQAQLASARTVLAERGANGDGDDGDEENRGDETGRTVRNEAGPEDGASVVEAGWPAVARGE